MTEIPDTSPAPRPPKGRTKIDPTTRFWAKVNKDGPMPATFRNRGPCWEWRAARTADGYGVFAATTSANMLAHRWSYESLIGPIPDGHVIDHLCRNRCCVNPAHLEPVPPGVNTIRGLGVSTFNRLKTHCPAGHPYSKENTYSAGRGDRRCRTCTLEQSRAWYQRSRAAS